MDSGARIDGDGPHGRRAEEPGQRSEAGAPPPPARRPWPQRLAAGVAALAVWLIAQVFTGLTLATTLVAAWVATHPVPVDVLLPDIQSLLPPPYTLNAETVEVRLSGWPNPVQVVAHGVEVGRSTDMVAIARVPELRLNLELAGLLAGEVRPTGLALIAPRLLVTREADGRVVAGLRLDSDTDDAAITAPPPQSGAELPDRLTLPMLTDPMSMASASDGPFTRLRVVEIRDATVLYFDRGHEIGWRIPDLSAVVRRSGGGITGALAFTLPDAGPEAHVAATLVQTLDGAVRLTADASGVVPSSLAPVDPVLAPLAALKSPVSVGIDLQLTRDLLPLTAELTASGRAVLLDAPDLYDRPVLMASLDAEVDVDFTQNTLEVTEARMDLGGPRIDAGATMSWDAETIRMVADATLTDMPMAELPHWWPPALNAPTRDWVAERMRDGMVVAASLGVATEASTQDPLDVDVTSVDASLIYDDLSVDYLPDLPPVTGIDGQATFDGANLTFQIAEAHVLDMPVDGGVVDIFGFDTPPEHITIDLAFAGPVSTALSVIDREPLGYARALGLTPQSVAGTADGELSFDFPLSERLAMDEVNVVVAAAIANGSVQNIFEGLAADNLDGALRVDRDGLTYDGLATLAGNRLQARWTEAFADYAPVRRTVNLAGSVRTASIAHLLPVVAERVDGPVAVSLAVADTGRGPLTIDLTADLAGAQVALPIADIDKPAGQPGEASGRISRLADGSWRLDPFAVSLPGVAADGALVLDGNGDFVQADLAHLTYGGQTAMVQIARQTTGYTIGLVADRIDLSDRFEDLTADSGADAGGQPANAAAGPPIWLTARIGALDLGGTRPLENVQATISLVGPDEVRALDLDATTGTAPLLVRYGPMGDGRDQLSVQADDAAAAFAALDMLHAVSGGRLLLTAVNTGGTWNGRARVEHLWLTQAPVLARLLANGPLPDLSTQLQAEGLLFDVLETPFTLTDGQLYLSDLRASGGALGVTAEGVINRISDTVDLQGTIVPFAGVNQVLGDIPLLGTILTGGDDQGVLALTFAVRGPLDDPAVSVNPLSALAPGIVRRILFEGGSEDDGQAVSEIDQQQR